jgi:hypothetical protein
MKYMSIYSYISLNGRDEISMGHREQPAFLRMILKSLPTSMWGMPQKKDAPMLTQQPQREMYPFLIKSRQEASDRGKNERQKKFAPGNGQMPGSLHPC